jgi:hypothetical protein
MTTARLLHKDPLFVAGLVLMTLGLGNYIAGDSKVTHYQEVSAEASPQERVNQSSFSDNKRHPFPSEARERLEIARAKLDFYQVVLSSGRLMISLGIGCILVALIRQRRRSHARSREKPLPLA